MKQLEKELDEALFNDLYQKHNCLSEKMAINDLNQKISRAKFSAKSSFLNIYCLITGAIGLTTILSTVKLLKFMPFHNFFSCVFMLTLAWVLWKIFDYGHKLYLNKYHFTIKPNLYFNRRVTKIQVEISALEGVISKTDNILREHFKEPELILAYFRNNRPELGHTNNKLYEANYIRLTQALETGQYAYALNTIFHLFKLQNPKKEKFIDKLKSYW